MKNLTKEAKEVFFFDKTDSFTFQANISYMILNSVSYNLIQLMKQFVFSKTQQKQTIGTIRFQFFRIAAKISYHARKVQIQLSSSHIFDKKFWQILMDIHRLKLHSTG